MPYRIRELDRELYLKLSRAWILNSHNMVDALKDDKVLDHYLDRHDAAWYHTKRDNVFFWLSSIEPGHQAMFHVLNGEGKASSTPEEYFPVLREIFTDHNLERLTAAVPASLGKVIAGAKKLCFTREGTMRKGSFFNGVFADVAILGLLREEVPAKEKKQRNRSRNRRKRPSGKTATPRKENQKAA